MDGQTDRQTDGRMDGLTNGRRWMETDGVGQRQREMNRDGQRWTETDGDR